MRLRRRALLAILAAGALAPRAAGAQPAALKDRAGTPAPERRAYDVDGTEIHLPPPDGV
jgi:hypothetical protein